jgi:hypothetical protein
MHAIMDVSGAGRILWDLADTLKREPSDVEEDFVRMLTPMIVSSLRSAKLLRG